MVLEYACPRIRSGCSQWALWLRTKPQGPQLTRACHTGRWLRVHAPQARRRCRRRRRQSRGAPPNISAALRRRADVLSAITTCRGSTKTWSSSRDLLLSPHKRVCGAVRRAARRLYRVTTQRRPSQRTRQRPPPRQCCNCPPRPCPLRRNDSAKHGPHVDTQHGDNRPTQ